jgi:Tol biopolymer transport system component
MSSPAYSPDAKRVAFQCNCPGGTGVWLATVGDTSRQLLDRSEGALPVGWSADGAWIYALESEQRRIVAIPAQRGAAEILAELPFERISAVDVAPDGQRIVCAVPETQADLWLVENFDLEARR